MTARVRMRPMTIMVVCLLSRHACHACTVFSLGGATLDIYMMYVWREAARCFAL